MNTQDSPTRCVAHGVRGSALVLVLGLILLLSIIALAFSRVLRSERLTARTAVNQVRASQLLHAGLNRAIADVDAQMQESCYPAVDAWASTGSEACPDLLAGAAPAMLPGAMLDAARGVTNACRWYQLDSSSGTNGRVAYIVVNCSGLLDANLTGGDQPRVWSTNVNELSLSHLPDVDSESDFLAHRDEHRRYDDVSELALNLGLSDPRHFFIYSYSPGERHFFTNHTQLGSRDIELFPKFFINGITNYAGYHAAAYDSYSADAGFMVDFFRPLTNVLREAGVHRPADAAWNLVNYLDPDSLPQSDSGYPWRDEAGCEAVPMLNELVLRECSPPLNAPSNEYEFVAELWYPFVRGDNRPPEDFRFRAAVFSNDVAESGSPPAPDNIMDEGNPAWSFDAACGALSGSGFVCVTSPTANRIAFPVACVFPVPGGGGTTYTVTNYLPLGRATYQTCPAGVTNTIVVTNRVWFLGRVLLDPSGLAVDEAMGYDVSDPDRAMLPWEETGGYAVADPRANGRLRYWTNATFEASAHSLGTTNPVCAPWAGNGQGVPVFHSDAPMRSAGEMGYVYEGCLWEEAPSAPYWRSIDIMDFWHGAALLDRMTVHATDHPRYGLVSVCTEQEPVVATLFVGAPLGCTNGIVTNRYFVSADDAAMVLAPSVDSGSLNMTALLGNAGADSAYRAWAPDGVHTNGDLKEDAFRSIVELVTFRQNLFTIVLAVQAFGPDQATVVAEKRAVAVVCRDAWTGRSFVHSLRPLLEW